MVQQVHAGIDHDESGNATAGVQWMQGACRDAGRFFSPRDKIKV